MIFAVLRVFDFIEVVKFAKLKYKIKIPALGLVIPDTLECHFLTCDQAVDLSLWPNLSNDMQTERSVLEWKDRHRTSSFIRKKILMMVLRSGLA